MAQSVTLGEQCSNTWGIVGFCAPRQNINMLPCVVQVSDECNRDPVYSIRRNLCLYIGLNNTMKMQGTK